MLEVPSITDLTAPLISHILSFLGPKDCCSFASVHKAWSTVASDDSLWRKFCENDFGILTKQDVQRETSLPTYKATYLHWHDELGKYDCMAKRAIVAWQSIEDWCRQHRPGILATLRPGASEAALDEVEERIGQTLPASLRALYRIHDGQTYDASTPPLHGLFGWFCVYGDLHSTFMYPLSHVRRACFPFKERHLLLFAASVIAATNIAVETMWVDPRVRSICTELGTGRMRLVSRSRMIDAAKSHTDSGAGEGLMRWFEAWAAALTRGYYQAKELDGSAEEMVYQGVRDEMRRRGEPLLGISLIPRLPPGQVEAVTRGVCVRAAVVFQLDDPMMGGRGFLFAYSIHMALLPLEQQEARWQQQGGQGTFRPLASAQLASRRWVIRNGAGAVENEVQGEGVIGEYPLLQAGGPAFEYQSCTQQQDLVGSMEGAFKFVEGSLASPTGPFFDVQCPRFLLKLPDYQF